VTPPSDDASRPTAPRLQRGDLPPEILVQPPGPVSRALSKTLAASEAPGVNTLVGPPGETPSLVWEEALGANVLDVDGNRFVDLTAGFGVAAVGHRHPEVVAAATTQAGRLLHGLGDVAAHPTRIALAERLCSLAPVDEPRVHYAISGADAVEIALKTALLATGRAAVLAFDPSYHGVTLGALAATSRDAFRTPFASHLHPHLHRLPYGCPLEDLQALAGRTPLAAVLVEPVVGREGVIPPPEGWLSALAALCRERGALLIADEIFTGFGRTGTLFAVDHQGVRPDLLCCGKALGGGLPVAATLGRAEIMAAWSTDGEALHTATHLAHPPACAAALAVLRILDRDDLPGRARRLGDQVERRLGTLPERSARVTAVRGRGLLWGIELDRPDTAKRMAASLLQRGLLVLAGGARGTVLQLVPPLTIAESQLALALDRLDDALDLL